MNHIPETGQRNHSDETCTRLSEKSRNNPRKGKAHLLAQLSEFDLKHSGKNISAAFLLASVFSAVLFPSGAVTAESYLTRSYGWDYEGWSWTWSLSIPQSLYDTYNSVSISDRTKNGLAGYGLLVTTQDYYVIQAANKLHEAAIQKGYGAYDEVSFILAFVQSLPYTSDSATTGYDDYPRFPIETLVDGGGDCEDTSILFATLVLILNYDAIFISPPDHCAVGVRGTNLDGYHYTYNSRTYYYCETTSDNWKIGEIPPEHKRTSASLFLIDKNSQYIPGRNSSNMLDPRLVSSLTVCLGVALICASYILKKRAKTRKPKETGPPPPPPPPPQLQCARWTHGLKRDICVLYTVRD